MSSNPHFSGDCSFTVEQYFHVQESSRYEKTTCLLHYMKQSCHIISLYDAVFHIQTHNDWLVRHSCITFMGQSEPTAEFGKMASRVLWCDML